MRLGRPAILLLAVAVSAVLAWWGTVGHGFVYDDHRFVERNRHLSDLAATPWRFLDPATTTADGPEPGMWRPLRTLDFALDRATFGPGPAGLHLSNVMLHALAAALVFAVGACVGLDDLAAGTGAAIFAFHPVQAETVAWISSRGDLLASVFVLGAVLLHLRRARPLWAAFLCGLALLAKESAVAAPLLMASADVAAGGAARLRERWRTLIPTAATLLLLAGVRAIVLHSAEVDPGQGRGLGLGPLGVASLLPAMFGWHAWRTLVPTPGAFDFQLQDAGAAIAGLSGLAVALLVLLAAWERIGLPRRAAAPARAAALWALAALLPVTLLQVVFPLKILVADRFLYLALAGPALAVGALARGLGEGPARGAITAAPLLLLAAFPAMNRWSSDEALWRDTVARSPANGRALWGLARARADRPGDALPLYEAAVAAQPGNPVAWLEKGLMEEALADGEGDSTMRRGLGLTAASSFHEAIGLWAKGEREGRARGLPMAHLARARLLAALGEDGNAEEEAAAGLDLLAEAPAGLRRTIASRLEALRAWAVARKKDGLASRLAAAAGGGP